MVDIDGATFVILLLFKCQESLWLQFWKVCLIVWLGALEATEYFAIDIDC